MKTSLDYTGLPTLAGNARDLSRWIMWDGAPVIKFKEHLDKPSSSGRFRCVCVEHAICGRVFGCGSVLPGSLAEFWQAHRANCAWPCAVAEGADPRSAPSHLYVRGNGEHV